MRGRRRLGTRTRRVGTRVGAGLLGAVAAVQLVAPQAAADTGGDGGGLLREQWALEAIGAREAWDAGAEDDAREGAERGSGATIAVVGTGVDPDHPDLRGEVTAGSDFSGAPGDGADGSSTALAGIAAASGHGREHVGGVLGSAPAAHVLSVRVAPDDGQAASDDALEQGIRHAADEGAQVVVVASGVSGGQDMDAVGAAVTDAVRSGALVLLPAGDPVAEAAPGVDGVLTVGAVDQAGTAAPDAADADLPAPGIGVEAIQPGEGYAQVTGSDAAAALAGGVGALVRAVNPQLLPDQAADAVTSGAEGGVLDAPAAVAAAGTTASEVPLYDENLVTEDPVLPFPMWILWVGIAVLLVAIAVVGVLLLRRRLANPYDLPADDEPVTVPASPDDERTRSIGRRRKGGGRRRK